MPVEGIQDCGSVDVCRRLFLIFVIAARIAEPLEKQLKIVVNHISPLISKVLG